MANEKRLIDNTREKLIELLKTIPQVNHAQAAVEGLDYVFGCAADYFIANGVTLDNQVSSSKWIPVTERLPDNFVSVLGYMTDAGDFTPVRECYTVGNAFFFPALCDKHPVSHWMPLPEPPKEVK